MKKTTLAVLLSLASMSGFSAELNHQGTLTNSNSQEPVEGTFNVTFSLYDEELLLWQSIRNVEFIAGVYQINLGSVNPINESIFSRSNINLGIKIEDDTEMSPRLSIDTFPKAYHAKVASSVKGQVDASSIFVAGEMIINEFGEWVGSPSGLEGKAGVDGKDGVNGLDGKDGVNGLDGKDGVNGLDGKDGVNGLDGKDGVNGLDGKDGINGLDGKSGFESKGLWDQNSQYIKNDFVTYQGSVFIALNNLQSSSESLTPKLDSSNWQLLVSKGDKGLDGKNGVDGIAGKDGLDGKNGVDGIAGKDGLDGKNGVDGIAGKDGLAGKNGVDGTAGKDGLDGTNGVDGIAGKDGKDGLRFRGVWDQNTEYVKNDFVTYQGNTYITLNNLQSDNESKMPELDSQNWKLFVAKGDKGLDGKDGIAGRDGTNGSNGKDGIAGIDGANGLDGKDGIAGKDGANGLDGKDGIAGKDGTNGLDGKDGIAGKDGANGLDGKDGIAGKDGANGLDGKDGIAGKDGANGLDGKDGIAGKDGANGLDGKDGIAGKDGTNGLDGKDGIAGRDGANGLDGKDGTAGRDGANGFNGNDGLNGKNGINGIAGKDGINGIDGTNGLNGRDGAPGINGKDGRSYLPAKLAALLQKVIFVTSQTYSGNLGGISGANQICQTVANSPYSIAPSASYKALLADDVQEITAALHESNTLYVDTFLQPLTTSARLKNGIEKLAAPNGGHLMNEYGAIQIGVEHKTWTGSDAMYRSNKNCENWSTESESALGDASSHIDLLDLVERSYFSFDYCSVKKSLLCIEQ